MIDTIEEARLMGLETEDWSIRAKHDPKEELRLQKALVRHHEIMLGEAQHRVSILESGYDQRA